jgi:hypothetical protein
MLIVLSPFGGMRRYQRNIRYSFSLNHPPGWTICAESTGYSCITDRTETD